MARKVNKITINQKDGHIQVFRNDELEWQCDLVKYAERIAQGRVTPIGFANYFAEVIHDCLNCKTASATLHDLNDMEQYQGTYFENIDYFED